MPRPMSKHHLSTLIYTFGCMIFAACLIAYPQEVFTASKRGLDAWWNIVFPALLPFFIVSHLMMSFGVVHFLGVLLEPLMQPIFNVPGNGAFVMAMGYTSGFPIGSVLTRDLRKNNLCTRLEGERLISFTNNASPLFMFGAIAIGMFEDPRLGAIIASAHYAANLLMGFLLRFHGYHDPEKQTHQINYKGILWRSFEEMFAVQQQNKEPFGKLLGTAVKKSVATLTSIGGFIILFSVVLEVLMQIGITPLISNFLGKLLTIFGMDYALSKSLSAGLFELTIGAKYASEISAPLVQQLVAVSLLLGWSGLSVHAQVASVIADTDLRFWPFVLSRLGQGILSAIFLVLFMGPVAPVFNQLNRAAVNTQAKADVWPVVWISLLVFALILAVITVIGIVSVAWRNSFGFHVR